MPLAASFVTKLVSGSGRPNVLQSDDVYLSLHTGSPATGANELGSSATSYARQRVSSGTTGWSLKTIGGKKYITNAAVIDFPQAGSNWGSIAAVAVTIGQSAGTLGTTPDAHFAPATPIPAPNGTRVSLAVDELRFELHEDLITAEGWKAIFDRGDLESVLANGYLALHTADPNTTNEVSGGGYARLNLSSAATFTEAGQTQGINVADTPSVRFGNLMNPTWSTPTHWALWSAATGGSILMRAALGTPVPGVPSTGYYFLDDANYSIVMPAPS